LGAPAAGGVPVPGLPLPGIGEPGPVAPGLVGAPAPGVPEPGACARTTAGVNNNAPRRANVVFFMSYDTSNPVPNVIMGVRHAGRHRWVTPGSSR